MLYLYLFHGRENPDQNLDDWGEEGPTFGPLQYVHTTYRDDIKVLAAGAADSVVLSTVGDCLYYDGMYYGDWSVYEADSPTRDLVQIDEAKAKPPKVESTAKVCRECGGPGFVLIPPSLKRKDAEIRRCLTCERHRDDGEAVEAAYNLACLALTQEINGYDDELDDPNHFEGED